VSINNNGAEKVKEGKAESCQSNIAKVKNIDRIASRFAF